MDKWFCLRNNNGVYTLANENNKIVKKVTEQDILKGMKKGSPFVNLCLDGKGCIVNRSPGEYYNDSTCPQYPLLRAVDMDIINAIFEMQFVEQKLKQDVENELHKYDVENELHKYDGVSIESIDVKCSAKPMSMMDCDIILDINMLVVINVNGVRYKFVIKENKIAGFYNNDNISSVCIKFFRVDNLYDVQRDVLITYKHIRYIDSVIKFVKKCMNTLCVSV